jgi:hypothetical protein
MRGLPWILEPSVNNKLNRREGSGSTGGFFDRANHKTELVVLVQILY